ncbi:MAG TPA: right-handed parallel beta-helix repeat-containing protein [Aquabacterium sp.]|nr:right-handed parallel beta-helix repeat-containing protein [Aquabacterium sp.]HRH27868.1 right-handed parallel beta-helix repeat-containing protein [Aquabacterium sp.]
MSVNPQLRVLVTCVMAVLASSSATARTWYFSSSAGNDTTANNSQSTPWLTLAKLQTLKLADGDEIALRCGDVWHETLTLSASANGTGKYVLRSEDCVAKAKPSIRGSVKLTNLSWTSDGAGVYRTSIPAGLSPAQAFFGGVHYTLARMPNANNAFEEPNNYALANGASGNTIQVKPNTTERQLLDANAADVKGATIYVRPQAWLTLQGTIDADYSAGTLVINQQLKNSDGYLPASTGPGFGAGSGYILENKRWMLDVPGEWYYNPTTGVLYLKPKNGGTPPATAELTTAASVVTLNGLNNFTMRNIDVRHGVVHGIQAIDTNQIKLDALSVSYTAVGKDTNLCTMAGVYIGPRRPVSVIAGCAPTSSYLLSSSATVQNSRFLTNGKSDLWVDTPNSTVSNNTFGATGLVGYASTVLAALQLSASTSSAKALASGNTFASVGYHAISFNSDNGGVVTVSGNVIDTYCVRHADCGGIYTFNGGFNNSTPKSPVGGKHSIKGNFIKNGQGDYTGQNLPSSSHLVAGIYLDEFTNNTTVEANVIDLAGIGIYLNSAYGNALTRNWVHGARRTGFLGADGGHGGGYLRGNSLSGNYFHAFNHFVLDNGQPRPRQSAGVSQAWMNFSADPAALFRTLSAPNACVTDAECAMRRLPNVVSSNTAVDAGSKTTQWRVMTGAGDDSYYTHDVGQWTWQQITNSSFEALTELARPKLVNLATPATRLLDSNFDSSTSPWFIQGGAANGAITLSAEAGCVGQCALVNYLNNGLGASLYSGDLSFPAASDLYYMEYQVQGASGAVANVNLQHSGWTQWVWPVKDGVRSHELGKASNARETRWFEGFFQAPVSGGTGVVVEGRQNQSIYLDQVRLFKVPTAITASNLYDPLSKTVLLFNGATSVNKPYALPSCTTEWVNERNQVVESSGTLQPGSVSMVFCQPDSTWAR